MKAKIISTLTYPAIVICVAVIVFIIIMVVAVPAFTSVFLELGTELPGITKGLIATSDFLTNYWWLLILIVLAFFIGRLLLKKERKGACVPCGKQAKALTAQRNAQYERRFAVCKHHEHHAHGGLADYESAGGHGKCGR